MQLEDLFGDAGEDFGMVFREFGEDLAVELDALLLEFPDELAVGTMAVLADGGIHANDPQATEIILLVAPVRKCVLARMHQ